MPNAIVCHFGARQPNRCRHPAKRRRSSVWCAGRGWRVYKALNPIEGRRVDYRDQKELWTAALSGADGPAAAALDRLCLSLGAVAGDIALAQGTSALVIAGGLGLRLASHLPRSGFRERFIAKGRFERHMDEIPVKIITHPSLVSLAQRRLSRASSASKRRGYQLGDLPSGRQQAALLNFHDRGR